jgi:hypothetical protein
MKVAQQGRVGRLGGLIVIAGTLLLLTASAKASTGGAGTGMAITVQNALTSTLFGVGARHGDVYIPQKAVCRSPFKPPEDWNPPKGPPLWANGKALGLQKDPPWARGKAKGLDKDPPQTNGKVTTVKARR